MIGGMKKIADGVIKNKNSLRVKKNRHREIEIISIDKDGNGKECQILFLRS